MLHVSPSRISQMILVLWRKPYRYWKPRFFVRTVEKRNRGFLEPSEYGFAFRRLCLYMVQSQWVGSGEETEGVFKVFSAAKIFAFNTWAAMRMLWKCIVRASNHCEVDRQRPSTWDLRNAIIHLTRRRRPWITGAGVCCNSIECTTNTSRKFALAWQLDTLFLWCSFCQHCTSAHFALQPHRRRPLWQAAGCAS